MTAIEVEEMTEADYHSHPALSASGAKLLLPPNCPAIYRYTMDNPPEPKDVFDIGHAAHTLVLGKGAPVVDVGFEAWTTAAAKKARSEAWGDGATPLRSQDYLAVHEMAKALRQHPIASALLSDGTAEQKLFWNDARTGVPLRGMLDYQIRTSDGVALVADYKSATSAAPEKFSRSLMDFGYCMQAAFYLDAVRANGIADEAAFVFVVQSKEPPYPVSCFEPDEQALQIGQHLMAQAIDIFQACTESGRWPSYSDRIESISVPSWVARQYQLGDAS